MKFYGRKDELALLRRIREGSRKSARFTGLTGRRRVGKTELIKRVYEDEGFLYFFVARRKTAEHCEMFAEEASPKLGVLPPARFERIAQVIRRVMTMTREREITLVIDEFQELLRIGRWRDRKGENAIDIVAEDELEKKALFIEVKRQKERASASDLDGKVDVFLMATGRFGRYAADRRILSLEDM